MSGAVSSRAGGVGLGLVAGWLAASTPLPRDPLRVGVLLAVIGAVTAETALLAGGDDAAWTLAAVALAFVLCRAARAAWTRGGRA